jgi:AbrB family looped-hinge helix DNA binding protein
MYLLCKEDTMTQALSVKVSSRYQIALPSIARQRLNIRKGDRLLVDIQDGCLILLPEPPDCAAKLAGLRREVWDGLDTAAYLQQERDAWQTSSKD